MIKRRHVAVGKGDPIAVATSRPTSDMPPRAAMTMRGQVPAPRWSINKNVCEAKSRGSSKGIAGGILIVIGAVVIWGVLRSKRGRGGYGT
jgi:hypothetical protein